MTIVYARAPKRIRRKEPAPERTKPPTVIIDNRTQKQREPFDAEEHRRRGDAVDALWRELVRRATSA